jgi:dTDP-glucose 4,6-dehydratase
MKKRVLVTGGAGFIGHHLIEHLLKNTDWDIVSLDRLDISGNLNRLSDIKIWGAEKKRVQIVFHDLKGAISDQVAQQIGSVQLILHLAAGTHVDRSIDDPMLFVLDNVVGTAHLLEYARKLPDLEKMIYFSTDEVFGPAAPGQAFKEWDRYRSANPYAASKAGAEELCLSYQNTYKLPVLISHTMNVFGERQHPEKFIPMTIRKILDGETVTIHADPTRTKAGSRFYVHARNVAGAMLFLLDKGIPGDKYNVVGEKEVDNLEMAQAIADILDRKLKYDMVDFHSSRPGHDLRYALDGAKMKEMGWEIPMTFEQSLKSTVLWSAERSAWLGAPQFTL